MQRGLIWTLGLLVAGTFCGSAEAQSNSLFRNAGNGPSAAPTTQPAGHAGETLPPPIPIPAPLQGIQPNEILLATALIAVPAPEPREIRVHDRVTIIIREEKRATSDSDLKSERKWEVEAELKKWIRLNEQSKLVPQVFAAGNPALDLEYEDKYEGKGKVGRKDSLTTRVTATVVDVKPNGDLVLEAKKDIRVDEDRQMITLTGTCRSADVTVQNTVLSTQLADARIDIQHTGPARDATRRGWLAQLWDLIRPL